MANEAVLLYELEPPIPFTCADGTGIEKGTILKLADPMTVSASNGANDVIGGIAAEEKIANDGKTKISVYRRGLFKVKASGAITAGVAVNSKGASNLVTAAAVNEENVLGISFETAAEAETFVMELNPTVMNLA